MRFFTARRLALAALVPALLLVCVVPGCSNESEGERCGTTQADDSDCADGLVCVDAMHLLNAPSGTFRCCYPGLMTVNDSRCLPASGVGSGGTGGSGGASGSAGTGGTSTGGTGGGDTSDAGDVTAAGAGGN